MKLKIKKFILTHQYLEIDLIYREIFLKVEYKHDLILSTGFFLQDTKIEERKRRDISRKYPCNYPIYIRIDIISLPLIF